MAVISLLTDFGDLYPSQMKAVILQINPGAVLVDISHAIPPQNIPAGAFALMVSVEYFPEGSVHVAVVDPGVGTSRRPLVIESGTHLLVGPDNGLLIPAARRLSGDLRIWEITNSDLFMDVSSTFHGRDIFAPVAAHLSMGMDCSEIGREIRKFVELDFGTPIMDKGMISGQIIYVDNFGNLITNIPDGLFYKKFKPGDQLIAAGNTLYFGHTYSDVEFGGLLMLAGSHGYLEVAVNSGNAAELLGLAAGDKIEICS